LRQKRLAVRKLMTRQLLRPRLSSKKGKLSMKLIGVRKKPNAQEMPLRLPSTDLFNPVACQTSLELRLHLPCPNWEHISPRPLD